MPGLAFGGAGLRPAGSRRVGLIAITIGLLLALVAPMTTVVGQDAAAAEWSAPRTVYIPETGQTLDQLFLDAWREGGGASSYGNPITPEITRDDGVVVQYLEYARFEYHPDGGADGNSFVIANIGEELRPFSLQRSVSSLTSTGGEQATASASALSMSAWLPVDPPVIESSHVRYVEETQHTVRYAFLEFWESTGEAGYLGNPLTEEYIVDGTTYQVFERGQLAWKNGQEAQMVPVGKLLADKYKLSQDPVAQGDIPEYSEDLFIPPAPPAPGVNAGVAPPANGERWIEINLSSQYLIAWQGDVPVLETYVSTGRPGFDTPTGTFHINTKLPSQDMEGVLGGEYYNVPQVPDVMYFTDVGHAIHGAYWHNNFGAVMSHGCVNVPLGTSTWLYDWAPVGTRVVIHY
jgi:hypothetical protein